MDKLSTTQRGALLAISKNSGLAIAEGGGWWKGADGTRLFVSTASVKDWVGTGTIYALEKRGLLKRLHVENLPYHRDTRAITDKGVAAVAELTDQEQDNG